MGVDLIYRCGEAKLAVRLTTGDLMMDVPASGAGVKVKARELLEAVEQVDR